MRKDIAATLQVLEDCEEFSERKISERERLLEEIRALDLRFNAERSKLLRRLQTLDAGVVQANKDFNEAKKRLDEMLKPVEGVTVSESVYEYTFSLPEPGSDKSVREGEES